MTRKRRFGSKTKRMSELDMRAILRNGHTFAEAREYSGALRRPGEKPAFDLYSIARSKPEMDQLADAWLAIGETISHLDGFRPWGWWQFGPLRRDQSMPETFQLAEADVLTVDAMTRLRAAPQQRFRRTPIWWHDNRETCAPDWSLPQIIVLSRRGELTGEERSVLADARTDRYAAAKYIYSTGREPSGYREPYLNIDHLKELKLDAAAELFAAA